jgi:hypothetical protein
MCCEDVELLNLKAGGTLELTNAENFYHQVCLIREAETYRTHS